MKKLSLLCSLSLVLSACAHNPTATSTDNSTTPQIVNYVCPMDTHFTVVYDSAQQTAVLSDASDRSFTLRAAPAASGAFYSNDAGVTLHEKNKEAIITLVKDRMIFCTEFVPS